MSETTAPTMSTDGSGPKPKSEGPALKTTGMEEETARTQSEMEGQAHDQVVSNEQAKGSAPSEPKETEPHAPASMENDDEEEGKIAFPILLHEIVCDPATDHCIHWLPNSNLFIISDKKKFAKEVLPKLNGHAKFTSFTRRLKRWGFSRIASGPQIGAYQNTDFIKEDPDRVKNIKYMHPKPLSMTAIQRNSAKLQAAKALNSVRIAGVEGFGAPVAAFGVQAMAPNLGMLQTLMAQQQQQQQMGMQIQGQGMNPQMEAFMRLAMNSGNAFAPSANNMAAMINNPMAMQLAMLQEMQNQHQRLQQQQQQQQHPRDSSFVAPAMASSGTDSAKPSESFGEKLVRTNPALAAQLLEGKQLDLSAVQGMQGTNLNTNNNVSNPNMMALLTGQNSINNTNSANPNMMALLTGQNMSANQQIQQQLPQHNQSFNPALLQQMGNQGGDQQHLTALMLARLQQEQQQQQAQQQQAHEQQQQQDFIKNFMSNQDNAQPRASETNTNSPPGSEGSLLVTPFNSAPSLQSEAPNSGMPRSTGGNWLSTLLSRSGNAGNFQEGNDPATNPHDCSGDCGKQV